MLKIDSSAVFLRKTTGLLDFISRLKRLGKY